jgi:methylated-DNA-protein-cysteine methyltransferase related protein
MIPEHPNTPYRTASTPREPDRTLRQRIYGHARRIPAGTVATYGDVARMAGVPRAARAVGWALGALPEGSDVPWWRVVNREGRISCRAHGMELQAELLRGEGVEMTEEGEIDLSRYRWGC